MAAFLLHRPRRHDMNQMEIFKNPEFGSIRTFEQDGMSRTARCCSAERM